MLIFVYIYNMHISIHILVYVSRCMLWTVDGEAYAQKAEKDSISDEGAYILLLYIYI